VDRDKRVKMRQNGMSHPPDCGVESTRAPSAPRKPMQTALVTKKFFFALGADADMGHRSNGPRAGLGTFPASRSYPLR
jgi:hypothetical protein